MQFFSPILLVISLGLLNGFAWWLADMTGTERALINLDYLLILLLLVVGRSSFILILFLLVSFFDFLNVLGQIFPVHRLSEIVDLIGYFGLAPPWVRFAVFAGFLIWTALFFLLRGAVTRARFLALLIVNAGVFLYLVEGISPAANAERVWRVEAGRFIDSQAYSFWKRRDSTFLNNLNGDGPVLQVLRGDSAMQRYLREKEGVAERLMLVVVESLGAYPPHISYKLFEPLKDYAAVNSRDVNIQEMAVSGFTIEAEFRELCALSLAGYNFTRGIPDLGQCLPNKLSEQGYATLGVHGATGRMYDRELWYPHIGFQHTVFWEPFKFETRCYSFPGVCDRELVHSMASFFEEASRGFGYWLTLNSHHLYDERDIDMDVFDCEAHGIETDSRMCRHLKLHAQFFVRLADLLSEPAMKDVDLVLVGDHPPPFIEPRYIAEGVVRDGQVSLLIIQ